MPSGAGISPARISAGFQMLSVIWCAVTCFPCVRRSFPCQRNRMRQECGSPANWPSSFIQGSS